MSSDNYGSKFWRIESSDGTSMQIMADSLEVTASGTLIAWGGYRKVKGAPLPDKETIPVLGLRAQEWDMFSAISCIDGDSLCVDSVGVFS